MLPSSVTFFTCHSIQGHVTAFENLILTSVTKVFIKLNPNEKYTSVNSSVTLSSETTLSCLDLMEEGNCVHFAL